MCEIHESLQVLDLCDVSIITYFYYNKMTAVTHHTTSQHPSTFLLCKVMYPHVSKIHESLSTLYYAADNIVLP